MAEQRNSKSPPAGQQPVGPHPLEVMGAAAQAAHARRAAEHRDSYQAGDADVEKARRDAGLPRPPGTGGAA
jgi:hypothetical protein